MLIYFSGLLIDKYPNSEQYFSSLRILAVNNTCNFHPPISRFAGQSRGSGSGTGSVPVDERKATYRRASFFQKQSSSFSSPSDTKAFSCHSEKKCDWGLNRFSPTETAREFLTHASRHSFLAFSLSLPLFVRIRYLSGSELVSLLPDFYSDFYLYSIGTTPITGDDRRNATLSPFDDLTVARSRSNIPMCLLEFFSFFFFLLNFSHGDPLPDAGRRRSSFAHRDVRPTSLSIFLRAAFRRFVIVLR